jgi:hypothetical protein
MNRNPLLLLLAALALPAAARAGGAGVQAPADPPQDLITPLDVRDPSSLVMGPLFDQKGGREVTVLMETLPAEPALSEAATKITSSEFSKDGPRAGKRAVSVFIGEDQLLDVKAGDRVDVVATFTAALAGEKGSERLTATVLQNVRVLGVAHVGSILAKGVIRLELNPIEAQFAPLAAEQAVLTLERRAPGDVELHPFEMSSLRKFFK